MQRKIPDLDNLIRKASAAKRGRAKIVTHHEAVRPPPRIVRTAFADVVSQLLHAERATEKMCRLIAGRSGSTLADALLAHQADDERHHAELYESYLARVGDIRPMDSRLSEALDAMRDTTFGTEAVIAAFNVVLEGEAVKLQQDCIERFTCPALSRITRSIGRDEARHVAFGHAFLKGAFANMMAEERFGIYRHIRHCWQIAAAPPEESGSLFATVLTRRRAEYMTARWHHHHAALQRLGLIDEHEKAPD
ncbi:MAG: hypothetical protein ACI9JL_003448 [Paracoccaceae bacterium]|jgi:hypothetical protein